MFLCSNPKARERAASIVSNPPKPDNNRVSDIRDFIQEQRKIINSFRSQPWPMKLKIEALKSVAIYIVLLRIIIISTNFLEITRRIFHTIYLISLLSIPFGKNQAGYAIVDNSSHGYCLSIMQAVIKQKQRFKRFTDLFIVWRSIIKKIEGHNNYCV